MYLMVQNSSGAYAMDVSDKAYVSASDISIDGSKLTSFENCKVWIESTTDRITTAKEATQGSKNWRDVNLTAGSNMTKTNDSGNATQSNLTGAMADVVYTANDGYYFPDNYVSTVTDLTNGVANGTQEAPNVTNGVDKIAGTTIAMEYILKSTYDESNSAQWSACSATNTVVSAGTYYVRLAKTDTLLAGEKAMVTITTVPAPPSAEPTVSPSTEPTASPSSKPMTVPVKGAKVNDTSGNKYVVTNAASKNPTVEYKAPKAGATSVIVPDTVKIDGVTYKVTSVAKRTC